MLFDDSKVYQQILKEFVAVKGAAHTPADSLRQRKLNKAAAKKQSAAALVDRRASKGRKIRYAEVPKLLNFTFPVNRTVVDSGDGNDLDERAWFKSLFGGAARAKA